VACAGAAIIPNRWHAAGPRDWRLLWAGVILFAVGAFIAVAVAISILFA